MSQSVVPEWQAAWIWGSGEPSPRNEWRCFRRTFTPGSPVRAASLRISADSRYVLYVDGKPIGRGPVRSWPSDWAYDEYEIGHLLKAEQECVIAVLVMHYGISTFQYIRGRGGLLLQLDMQNADESLAPTSQNGAAWSLVTDASWKTAVHQGHDANSSRISCQMAFTEIVDAGKWDDRWVTAAYDDSGWEQASVIGPVGVEPWTGLVPRDIPFLTEEPIYPSRVESMCGVQPSAWGAVIDLYGMMSPNSGYHANNTAFCAYLAARVTLAEAGAFTIGLPDSGRVDPLIRIDGHLYESKDYAGEHPERYLTVALEGGEHLLLMDVTGVSHGHGFHIGFDSEVPFRLQAVGVQEDGALEGGVLAAVKAEKGAAVAGESGVKPHTPEFSLIGPFDAVAIVDHQPTRLLNREHPDYQAIRQAASASDLKPFVAWIRPVDTPFINRNDVFAACVWKKAQTKLPMPASLQQAVIASPDAAVLPVLEEMDTEIVIDFGRELSGYLAFEVDAAAGTVIDLYGFEFMKDGWRQHTYQLDNTLRYRCREGRQSYASYIRRGLRYLALTVREAARPVRLYEAKMIQSNFPVANIGSFQCSDALLNEIWSISRDTTRLCMEDTFVDCPAYEQAYWVGDARNEALVGYYAFGAKEIVERCLKLVPGSDFQTPLYADQVPSGWNSVIPNWTFFWVTACFEYYHYTGRDSFLSGIWPHVKRTMEQYLKYMDERGLFSFEGWNLLDWAPFEQPHAGVVTPQNMFLRRTLCHAAEIGAIAGDQESAARFREEAAKLKTSIHAYLWDETRQAYADCIRRDGSFSETLSAQTQVVAYLCDMAEGERLEKLTSYILDPPHSFVKIGSPFMSFFYYEALARMGRLDVMLNDIRESYGIMIENGATACWEMYPWSGLFEDPRMLTRSHCHAWSAGPAYFLGAYILGVQGASPGWAKIKVAPHPCGLKRASGSVPHPDGGRIDVSWRIEGKERIVLFIAAPPEVDVETETPEGYDMKVEFL
ncbi:family 78 glycoside hydrolase catalytic domain [Paenibacillus sp. VCA1]|uniref:family 78 glycoside hydrolase catalytic domain n=1 Tax=Paenibacillus sp. VCA1 TaxID=3039148 RepID=UPI0037CAE4C5